VSSVSTLLTIRQGTGHLRRRIGELDGQMGDVGRALGEKVSVDSFNDWAKCVETGLARAKESRQEYGRCYRDSSNMLEAAGPGSSCGRDDSRGEILGSSEGRS